jgi:hydroxymethylglutaryl-CoA lyase
MTLPQVFPHAGLPERVTVYEVGARDGLQNEKTVVPTEAKAEFIGRLADAGARIIEATSFVHPKWVPQLADAAELIPLLPQRTGLRFPVLVPSRPRSPTSPCSPPPPRPSRRRT